MEGSLTVRFPSIYDTAPINKVQAKAWWAWTQCYYVVYYNDQGEEIDPPAATSDILSYENFWEHRNIEGTYERDLNPDGTYSSWRWRYRGVPARVRR